MVAKNIEHLNVLRSIAAYGVNLIENPLIYFLNSEASLVIAFIIELTIG